MGNILSRLGKKKSTVEVLEKLENEIKEIEQSRCYAQRRYNKIKQLFVVYSLGSYILLGVFFYFQYTMSLKDKLLYLVPLAISPLLFYLVSKIISWYYARIINVNQSRLLEIKKEKKKLIDEVLDKETYKVAKQILDKFCNDNVPKSNLNKNLTLYQQPQTGLTKRFVSTSHMPNPQYMNVVNYQTSRNNQPANVIQQQRNSYPALSKTLHGMQTPRLPAPIIPINRTYVDKVFEYLIGDGPNNRYALICSQCHSHNGMALKEEFEYIGFKCCYCFFYNPARKARPEAPKLENPGMVESDSDSDSKTPLEIREFGYAVESDKINELGETSTNVSEDLGSHSPNDDKSSDPDAIANNLSSDHEATATTVVDDEEVSQEKTEEEDKRTPSDNNESCD